MSANAMDLTVKPQEFFHEKVTQALANQKIEIDDHVEFYLVNLLCEFILPGKIETLTGEIDALETPLALMLKEAVEAPRSQRIKIFKYLGDTSLYLSGFFQDYFNRKTFDIEYYIGLGRGAYFNVAEIMNDAHSDEHFRDIYSQLGNQFDTLVEVVAEVADTSVSTGSKDLLALYDRWTRNQSDRLRRTLEQHGISPVPLSTAKTKQ